MDFFGSTNSTELGVWYAWLYLAQAVFAALNVGTLIFLYQQIKSSREQADKDYIVSVGRHSDEIYACLSDQDKKDSDIIKELYSDEVNKNWSDEAFYKYWYCRRIFAHVARMAALACEPSASRDVKAYFDSWITELKLRIENDSGAEKLPEKKPMMRIVAERAVYSESWNDHIRWHVWPFVRGVEDKMPEELKRIGEKIERETLQRGWRKFIPLKILKSFASKKANKMVCPNKQSSAPTPPPEASSDKH